VPSNGEIGEGARVAHDAASREAADIWESLVRRIEQGDRAAEAELADRFYPRVRAMARARLHGSPDAVDIAQDTILGVLEALRARRLRDPGRLPAFVLSTARNLINGHRRDEARSREVLGDPPGEPLRCTPSPLEIDDERRLALVAEAMNRLKPLDRRILQLTFVDGLTSREISPIVGLSPDAVRTRKARALKAVAQSVRKRRHRPAAGTT